MKNKTLHAGFRKTLVVMVKNPRLGEVKTRLGKDIGSVELPSASCNVSNFDVCRYGLCLVKGSQQLTSVLNVHNWLEFGSETLSELGWWFVTLATEYEEKKGKGM